MPCQNVASWGGPTLGARVKGGGVHARPDAATVPSALSSRTSSRRTAPSRLRSTPGNATGRAAKGLAIVTCMDARIDPLAVVGMRVGDAKILRNPGARVTEDVLGRLFLRPAFWA